MKRLFVLIIAFVLVNCKQEDVAPEPTAELFLNGQKESGINPSVAATESCGYFILNSIDFPNTLPVYNLSIQLIESGRVANILVNTKEGGRYETQTATPERHIIISDFKRDTLAKTISFNLRGKLFTPGSLTKSIDVSARFKNISVKSYGCNLPITTLTGTVQDRTKSIKVETLFANPGNSSVNDGTNRKTYFQNFLLTDLFNVTLRSSVSFKSLPVGSYNFGTGLSAPFSIRFQEYIGLYDPHGIYAYLPEDWRNFTTDGTLTIAEQTQLNGRPYTLGTISFRAVDASGDIRYDFKQGTFRFINID